MEVAGLRHASGKMLIIRQIEDLEAAGVERELGAIVNFLMARDFWG